MPQAWEPGRYDLWQRFERLSTAAIRITAEHELDLVLQEIADSAREVVGARYAALGVLNDTGDGLKQLVVSGITDKEVARLGELPRGRGVLGVLIDDPRPLRLKDLSSHPKSYGFPPHHPSMTSFLGVPILGRAGPIGNLYLTEKQGAEEFTEQDEAFAVLLAAHAAVAVENARFHEERERLLSEVRSMQVSRDRFFAMINHELRNALTAVHGWAELWLRKAGSRAPRSAREVYESAQRALTLLEDLLDLSQLDASKLEPRVREVDGWEVARESVSSVEPAAEWRGIRIETAGPGTVQSLRTDPQRVRQILINLLTNAVRHSPEDGVVTVELDQGEESIRFHVVDRGDGIAPRDQVVIFEAFERSGRDTERGTGLGLAVSRKLARLLGGDLSVESRAGAGARFTLELPRHPEPS